MTTLAEKGNLWVPPEYMSNDKKKKLRRNNLIFGVVALALTTIIAFLIRNDVTGYSKDNRYSVIDHNLVRHYSYGSDYITNTILLMVLAAAAAVFIGLAIGERSNLLIPTAAIGIVVLIAINFTLTGFSMKNVEARHDMNNWFKQETGYSQNIEKTFVHTKARSIPDNLVVTAKDGKTFIVERERADNKIIYSVKEMEAKTS